MRNELLSWFAHEGLLLQEVIAEEPDDEIKVTLRAPVIALSKNDSDFRECPDPVLFGYPESSLDMMNLDDMHAFVMEWLERAVSTRLGRCFVCNLQLDLGAEKPWDAVFVTKDIYCWLMVHFDCKKYLNRDLKGRNPFEISVSPPEFFDLYLE